MIMNDADDGDGNGDDDHDDNVISSMVFLVMVSLAF